MDNIFPWRIFFLLSNIYAELDFRLANGGSDTESPARRPKNTPIKTKEPASKTTKTAPTKPTPKSKEAVAKKNDEKKDKENRSKSKETVTTAKKDDKTTSRYMAKGSRKKVPQLMARPFLVVRLLRP